jgi:hypothetical protein
MIKSRLATPISLLALAFPIHAGIAQEQTLRLKEALYFDCVVSPADASDPTVDFDVSYLVYSDRPNLPQVNFRDPHKIVVSETGWAKPDSFVLSQRVSDGSLFLWAGQQVSGSPPKISASIALEMAAGAVNEARVLVRTFEATSNDSVSSVVHAGSCTQTSGEEAYYRFSRGGAG